jgi:hypothetical protein
MANSITDYGYTTLTNYRNSFADENGYIGRFTRVAFEFGYGGVALFGAFETSVHAIYALTVKGVTFLGCFIPLQCMMAHLNNMDAYFTQVVKLRVISSGAATTASALGLVNSLWTSGSLDAAAQTLAVKKYADKHLVSNMRPHHKKYAKPFILPAFKALTKWRNDFIDPETHKVVTTTKVFKQLSAVPLYLGVAALGTVETLARAVYMVAVYILWTMLICLAIAASPPVLLEHCLAWINPQPIKRAFAQVFDGMPYHLYGAAASAGYTLSTSIAALLSLKDNFMKNTGFGGGGLIVHRMYEPGQIDHKKQIDVAMRIALICALTPAFAIGGPLFALGAVIFNLVVLPLYAMAKGIYRAGVAALAGVCQVMRALLHALYGVGTALFNGGYHVGEVLAKGLYDVGKGTVQIATVAGGVAGLIAFHTGKSILECFYPSSYY